jgi:hypothetical protein
MRVAMATRPLLPRCWFELPMLYEDGRPKLRVAASGRYKDNQRRETFLTFAEAARSTTANTAVDGREVPPGAYPADFSHAAVSAARVRVRGLCDES